MHTAKNVITLRKKDFSEWSFVKTFDRSDKAPKKIIKSMVISCDQKKGRSYMNNNLRRELENMLEDYSIEELEEKREKLALWDNEHHARKLWDSTHYDKPWKKRKCVYKDSVSIGNTVICYEENYLLNDYWDEKVWIDGSDEKVTMGDIGFFNSKIYVLCISKRKSSIKEERR